MGTRKKESAAMADDPLLAPYQAARLIPKSDGRPVSPATVRRLVDLGQLPALRMADGRRIIRQSDVERLALKRLARQREAQRQVVA